MATWNHLPPEIRLLVLNALVAAGFRLANFVTVSREWQSVIEPHIFSRITLTLARLPEMNRMTHRSRHLISSLHICIELGRYDCKKCMGEDPDYFGLSDRDNSLITTIFQDLFSPLSKWEHKQCGLILDISIYSPSDSEHWFKYLTFEPDVPIHRLDQYVQDKRRILCDANDRRHGWNDAAHQESLPDRTAIETVFEEIMGEGPFDTEEEEREWWNKLPLVSAITAIRLRQQTRRRWKPAALVHLFSRFPQLEEIHYEPWREWDRAIEPWTDRG
jgi:hypothetical protein